MPLIFSSVAVTFVLQGFLHKPLKNLLELIGKVKIFVRISFSFFLFEYLINCMKEVNVTSLSVQILKTSLL